MLKAEVNPVITPLIKRRIFATEDQAIRELLREYMVRQIAALHREMGRFQRKYGRDVGIVLQAISTFLSGKQNGSRQKIEEY